MLLLAICIETGTFCKESKGFPGKQTSLSSIEQSKEFCSSSKSRRLHG